MIRECFIAKTGILFKEDLLNDLGLSLQHLEVDPQNVMIYNLPDEDWAPPPVQKPATLLQRLAALFQRPAALLQNPTMDVFAQIYDQLCEQKFWWILEVFPMLDVVQMADGSWFRSRLSVRSQSTWFPAR